jgi:serine/threonine-protein kinase RsbW
MIENFEIDIKVPNETRYLALIGQIGENIARTIKRYKGDRSELAYQINLVLTEAMSNAILHAVEDNNDDRQIHINISIINNNLHIKVYDQGKGFDLDNLPPQDFKGLKEGGRGIFIIQSIMDSVSCRKEGNGHVIEMIKYLP